MTINKYNHEGYYDPTAHEALTNICRRSKTERKPLVFVSSPFAGDIEKNTENARKFCKYAVAMGAIPFAPHLLYPQILDDSIKAERILGISFGLEILKRCDEIWVFGNRISRGMEIEIKAAKSLRIQIRYFTKEVEIDEKH